MKIKIIPPFIWNRYPKVRAFMGFWAVYPKRVRMYKTLFPMRKKYRAMSRKRSRKVYESKYGKVRISQGRRSLVYFLDHHRCLRCGSKKNLTCDHIVPQSAGGPKEVWNLQTLCNSCNQKKANSYHDYRREKYELLAKISFLLRQHFDNKCKNVFQPPCPQVIPLPEMDELRVR